MISVHWHLVLYIVLIVWMLFGAFRESDGGDYSFDLMPLVCIIGIIVITAIYGGIFWW